jgi:hypothetical protein
MNLITVRLDVIAALLPAHHRRGCRFVGTEAEESARGSKVGSITNDMEVSLAGN